VLVYSAEKLIGYLVGVSSRWAISLFLIAVVFTGIEFDDLAFGIVLNLEDLSEVALGTVTWDSLQQVHLILALEEEFGMQFEVDQIAVMRGVRPIVAMIRERAGPG
jgi:acyl carrier protein